MTRAHSYTRSFDFIMLVPDVVDQFLRAVYRIHDEHDSTILRWLAQVGQHPVIAFAVAMYLMRVPIVEVQMSADERSRVNWLYDHRRPWNPRGFVSSYLELPTELENYWRGPAKQELRRRSAQAKASGLEARAVSMSEIIPVIAKVYRADIDGRVGEIAKNLEDMRMRNDGALLEKSICVGVFEGDTPVAFSLGVQSGNAVNTMLAGTSVRGTARWLCFSGFVEEVFARGGRFIIQPPQWALTSGNKIFAEHLGFLPGRVRCPEPAEVLEDVASRSPSIL